MTQIAFKIPGGNEALTWASGADAFERVDIDSWMAGVLGTHAWTGWFCYNDSILQRRDVPTSGECKGVVLWNDAAVGWLVHTVPWWPVDGPLETFPAAELDQGHSFAWWCGTAAKLPKIEAQIDLMGGRVYCGRRLMLYDIPQHGTLQRIILDPTTHHVAKNRTWGRDVYESLGRCVSVQTHWAVGDDWLFVADVPRGHLAPRGCGGIVVRDAGLVRAVCRK
jgi:hypothetical protein